MYLLASNGFWPLWLVYVLLSAFLWVQIVKIGKTETLPFYKVNLFYFFVAITVAAIIIYFVIHASYK